MSPTRSLLPRLSVLLLVCLLNAGNAQAQTQAQTEISALLKEGHPRQALAEADEAIRVSPHDPQLQFLKANAELELGHTEAADATLTHLTQTYPELPEPWNNLATIRAYQGRLAEARSMLEQALTADPDYAQAHANLAEVLLQQAIAQLEDAERLAPGPQTRARLKALQAAAREGASPAPKN